MLLVVLSLALGCRQQTPERAAAEPPKSEPLKSIEIRGTDAARATLAVPAAAPAADQSAKKPLTTASMMTSNASPSMSAEPQAKKPAKMFEGAYVEPRGPCNGRPIAGYIGTGSDRQPICGSESRESPYGRYGYGYTSASEDRANSRYGLRGQPTRRVYYYDTPRNR